MKAARGRQLTLDAIIAFQTLSFLFLPVAFIGYYSFATRDATGGIEHSFTLEAWKRLVSSSTVGVVIRSLFLAMETVVGCLVLGLPACLYLSQARPLIRTVGLAALLVPMVLNPLLVAYSWYVMLGRDGIVSRLLVAAHLTDEPVSFLFSHAAVLLGMIGAYLPYFCLVVLSAIRRLDAGLLLVSSALGATNGQTRRFIVVPLVRHAIIAGSLLVGLPAFADFLVPSVLGGNRSFFVGTQIQYAFYAGRDWPFGSALLIATVVLLSLPTAFLVRKTRSAIRGDIE